MVDRLAALFAHFAVSAKAIQTGAWRGKYIIEDKEPYGQLHLLRKGNVEVRHGRDVTLRLTQPSLLFYPRPMPHRFIVDRDNEAAFVCARVSFEGGAANPILAALPPFVCMPLRQLHGSEGLLELLFFEASTQHCGYQAMLDRLFEIVVIQVLRQLMEQGQIKTGMLAGLAHPQLRRALVAMHEQPDKDWSLEELATVSHMSRSVFARVFRDTVGDTPGSYLQRWRIGLAKKALLKERSLKLIAQDVGYGSEAALSRAFKMLVGLSPREWRRAQAISPA
jgi:AraC-like DNA-binding protein